MGFSKFFSGALKLIPGVGNVVAALEGVGQIAQAIGGDTGKKISQGVSQITEGLKEVDKQELPPEKLAEVQKAAMNLKIRLRELDLDEQRIETSDADSARDFAAKEILSEDEYVRRTRPSIVRFYGKGTLIVIGLLMVGVFTLVSLADLNQTEASLIGQLALYCIGFLASCFAMVFRAYSTKRSQDKMIAAGMMPEGLLDKFLKLKGK